MMLGLFLMLWGGVGFIQDKRFFSSAPKEVQNVVPDKMPERFKGQHTVGWVMIVLSFLLMGGAIILGAWDGINNNFDFWRFFLRFVIMLVGLKAYDIGFFDWVLLCNAGFGFFSALLSRNKACARTLPVRVQLEDTSFAYSFRNTGLCAVVVGLYPIING